MTAEQFWIYYFLLCSFTNAYIAMSVKDKAVVDLEGHGMFAKLFITGFVAVVSPLVYAASLIISWKNKLKG